MRISALNSRPTSISAGKRFTTMQPTAQPTMVTSASRPLRGRRVKFTTQVIDTIKQLVEEGLSRDEIAHRLGVTLGSLQVTCSRLGISLRRRGSGRRLAHTAHPNGVAHVAPATPSFKLELLMRHQGEERTSDIPLPLSELGQLAIEATSRDIKVPELVGKLLVASINKRMLHKILR
jgi:hypothetical protein